MDSTALFLTLIYIFLFLIIILTDLASCGSYDPDLIFHRTSSKEDDQHDRDKAAEKSTVANQIQGPSNSNVDQVVKKNPVTKQIQGPSNDSIDQVVLNIDVLISCNRC